MDICTEVKSALDVIMPKVHRTEQDPRPVVVMTCGISGSGKSTLAKGIVTSLPAFTRLSIDAIICKLHGLYDVDYPADKYMEYQIEAKTRLIVELHFLLREQQRDVVLDLSFWNKEYRQEFKTRIEEDGGRWVLVFLDASKEVLWSRIEERKARRDSLVETDKERDGDSAFDVDEEVFEQYWSGFERPTGEGETVIKVG